MASTVSTNKRSSFSLQAGNSEPNKLRKSFFRQLGPGLITGASDDDPSGIATYSQVGAQFGFTILWTMLFTYPLMAAMQEICARVGRVTGLGLAANIRKHYSRSVLVSLVVLLCAANIFNLGADIAAMASATQLLIPGSLHFYAILFCVLSLVLQIYVPYTQYVKYLKWLTLALFAYVITAFVVHVPWKIALRATIWPTLSFNTPYFTALVAVLGTTISPYLFFWQASEEAEDVRINKGEWPLKRAPWQAAEHFERIKVDTYSGMAFSNLVAFFIILTTAATLYVHGVGGDIATSAQAAKALEPLAGKFAFVLFAMGIIGTGLLAVPILAGSAAYGVAEAFKWKASLEKRPRQAREFYGVLVAATLIGLAINFAGIDPIRALFWSAVTNGISAAPLMVVAMLLSNSSRVMGRFTLPAGLKAVGWLATGVMFLASLGLFVSFIRK